MGGAGRSANTRGADCQTRACFKLAPSGASAVRYGLQLRASTSLRLLRAGNDAAAARPRFQYLEEDGDRVTDPEHVERITSLVIPPAWREVWICPHPGGHIQATGVDARGRKQYLYHQRWRERRDQQKFEDMVAFAKRLPQLRARIDDDLAAAPMSKEQVLAVAVRLLDRGFFRIGGEDYAVENETYGLATMRKRHVAVDGDRLVFDYPAKHGKRRVQSVIDDDVATIVLDLRRRRSGGEELLAYKRGRRWVDVRSTDINEYIKTAIGQSVSAKDFRTWGATVLAAVSVSIAEPHVAPRRRVSGS